MDPTVCSEYCTTMPMCTSSCLQSVLAVTVYFLAVLLTCSTRECDLQMKEKMKRRSVLLKTVDMEFCQVECIEESYIFVSCHQSSDRSKQIEETSGSSVHTKNRPNVLTKSCGSKVCNATSQCLDDGCRMVCLEDCVTVATMSDLHGASVSGDLSKVNFILSREQADVDCKDWIGRTPVIWAAGKGHIDVVDLLVTKGANLSLVDSRGLNILHAACQGGDVEVVKYVISQDKVDINGRVLCGKTPVMLAAENGHQEVMEVLVVKGASVSLVDITGNSILHCACRRGNVDVVKYIVSKKLVNINSRERKKKTPLMVACMWGHKAVVELLVLQGAHQSLRDKNGQNILHYACRGGHTEVVKYIISLDTIDVNCRGLKKTTPVMIAGRRGHKDVVELLVQNGANLSLMDARGDNIFHYACSTGYVEVVKYVLSLKTVDINSRGNHNKTAVMVAGRRGHRNVIEFLVKYGANLSLKDARGDNIFHYACSRGHVDVVKYVLSQKTVDINSRGNNNKTPVMVAVERGHRNVVELLVIFRANLSLRDARGDNILHYACLGGHVDVVKCVVSQKTVDINSRGNDKKTPVMVAGERGRTNVVELLVNFGAILSLRDARGDNIFHYACSRGHEDVVKYVLSLKTVDINSRGNHNKTAVMVAGRRGHRHVVELLVNFGANLSLRDARGNNIFHYACTRGHVEVVKYVLSQNTVDINSRGNDNKTPAMVAGERGHRNVVELLVKYGANLSLTDIHCNNILHLACRGGHVGVVEYILSQGTVDVNAKNKRKESAVTIATTLGRRHVLEVLLSHGTIGLQGQ